MKQRRQLLRRRRRVSLGLEPGHGAFANHPNARAKDSPRPDPRARSSDDRKGRSAFHAFDGKQDEIRRFLKITGVSRPTLYHFIGTRGLSLGP